MSEKAIEELAKAHERVIAFYRQEVNRMADKAFRAGFEAGEYHGTCCPPEYNGTKLGPMLKEFMDNPMNFPRVPR